MPDQSHYLSGGATTSVLHPLVAAALVIALVLVVILPRKYVIVPLLSFAFLVPLGQQIYFIGVHWLVLRVVVLAGLARMLTNSGKKEWLAGRFNSVDYAFVVCTVCQAMGFVLRYMSADAMVNQLGFLIDFLACYLVLRVLIRDESDMHRALKALAVLSLILAACMIREQQTTENIFGYLGGVKLTPDIREGKIRSQGVFQHSLTAGTYAASLLPLFLLLWRHGRAKLWALGGVIGCTGMVICSNCSTPLLTYTAGLAAILLWPVRRHLRTIRITFVICFIALQFVIKAPVWFLMARVDLTGGSSGYHRAELVDMFVRRFSEWWLIGKDDSLNWGWDMWDLQNQYVLVGQQGGLVAFVFLVTMIARICGRLGDARRMFTGKREESMVWLLGASLFATLVGFFGVTYFDQAKVGWMLLLAIISAITSMLFRSVQQASAAEEEARATSLFEPEPAASTAFRSLSD